MRFVFFFLILFLFPLVSFSDEITHQLGNSGYAVREAMQAGAPKESPYHYWKAVRLQDEARKAFSRRAIDRAVELSKQAYAEAKLALAYCKRGQN